MSVSQSPQRSVLLHCNYTVNQAFERKRCICSLKSGGSNHNNYKKAIFTPTYFNSIHTLASVSFPTNSAAFPSGFVHFFSWMWRNSLSRNASSPALKDELRGRHAKRLGGLSSQLGRQNKEGGLNEVLSWSCWVNCVSLTLLMARWQDGKSSCVRASAGICAKPRKHCC